MDPAIRPHQIGFSNAVKIDLLNNSAPEYKITIARPQYRPNPPIISYSEGVALGQKIRESIESLSLGKIRVSFQVTPVLNMSESLSNYNAAKAFNEISSIIAQRHPQMSNYHNLMVFTEKYWTGGSKGLGSQTVGACAISRNSPSLAVHEWGHSIGLPHSSGLVGNYKSPEREEEYGDVSNIMGGSLTWNVLLTPVLGGHPKPLNMHAMQKVLLGWIPARNVPVVDNLVGQTISLLPIYDPRLTIPGGGVAGIRIRKDWETDHLMINNSGQACVLEIPHSEEEPSLDLFRHRGWTQRKSYLYDLTPDSQPPLNPVEDFKGRRSSHRSVI